MIRVLIISGLLILFSLKIVAENNSELILKKLNDMEIRLERIEKMILPFEDKLKAESRRQTYRTNFNNRNKKDSENFSKEDSKKIEKLYQVANKDWRSDAAKKNIEELIDKYPGHNRTGCSILYLAQWKDGDEAKKYLKIAIEKYNDSFYGDGVQVGAYAKFLLAKLLMSENQKDEAANLFEDLRTNYKDAIDHKGNLLLDQFSK